MSDRLFALIAIKDPARGKSRLSPFLSPAQRASLNVWLAERTLQCCARVLDPQRAVVITPTDEVAAHATRLGMQVLRETVFGDVNATVAEAARHAMGAGAEALLVVPTDLPLLTDAALRAVMERLRAERGFVIVPDRRGTGSNLIGVSPPRADLFRFGEGSFERHCRLAREAQLPLLVHRDAALEFDLDLPEDYRDWQAVQSWSV